MNKYSMILSLMDMCDEFYLKVWYLLKIDMFCVKLYNGFVDGMFCLFVY